MYTSHTLNGWRHCWLITGFGWYLNSICHRSQFWRAIAKGFQTDIVKDLRYGVTSVMFYVQFSTLCLVMIEKYRLYVNTHQYTWMHEWMTGYMYGWQIIGRAAWQTTTGLKYKVLGFKRWLMENRVTRCKHRNTWQIWNQFQANAEIFTVCSQYVVAQPSIN